MSTPTFIPQQPVVRLHALLKENPTLLDQQQTMQLIKNILQNIVAHPYDDKFRSIKLSNPKLSEKIVQVKGALDILLLCGFSRVRENNEEYIKLYDADVQSMEVMKKIIETYVGIETF